ncbi:hypothetical protein RMCBS344292_08492 [Rhizopus microsporus]|nr:hypothetical protein RMCBS344292_08492 [Rhizopus microsporus]
MGYPTSNISHSTIRRGTATNNKRASNRSISPALVYDYALRCAFIVWFEQRKVRGKKRHSFYMALVEAGRKDRLQPEVIRSLNHKLEAIYAERDISKPEYLNTAFRAVCKSFKDKLSESRCKSINDLADMLMHTCDIKEFHAVIVDIIVQTVQEETSHVVTQDLLEKLSVKATQNKRTSAVDMNSIESFPMVNHIKELFRVQEKEHQSKLSELAVICTKTALLRDLKQAIHSIHINQSWVKKDDFETAGAYEQWQKVEIKQLAERMNTIIQMYPDISLGSLQPDNESISDFYPKDYFRYLMNVCIDYNRTYNIRPSHLLSEESEDLLKECWKTWRLSWPFRAAIYLNSVKAMLQNHGIGIDQVKESIKTLERVVKDYPIDFWATSDSSFVKRVLIGLNNALMHELANELTEYWNIRQ